MVDGVWGWARYTPGGCDMWTCLSEKKVRNSGQGDSGMVPGEHIEA